VGFVECLFFLGEESFCPIGMQDPIMISTFSVVITRGNEKGERERGRIAGAVGNFLLTLKLND